jgi:hypothetical protein
MEEYGPGGFIHIARPWWQPCRRCGQQVDEIDDAGPGLCPECWQVDRSRYAGQLEFD